MKGGCDLDLGVLLLQLKSQVLNDLIYRSFEIEE